jgi:hypothetical protein
MKTNTTTTSEERKLIAKTILQQLGGGRFLTMTGAKNLVALDAGLQFSVPRTLTKNRINKIQIHLTPSDTYLVAFFTCQKLDAKLVSKVDGVYCDQLEEVVSEVTGLATRL